jgi:hypothetical protein
MALNLRERFAGRGSEPRAALAEEFEFSPADYPSLREYRVEHEEVSLLEAPLAVDRQYFLTHGSDSLKLEFALCLTGSEAAFELLVLRATAFQREPAEAAVVDLARSDNIGDVGVAWSWGSNERDGVVGFVRHNVLVFMQGRHETLLEHARAIYAGSEETLFDVGDKDGALATAPGGRVDLGVPVAPDMRHFFVASGGSVNRDASNLSLHYFRAGLDKGSQQVQIFRVGRGLLPARQTIRITIS